MLALFDLGINQSINQSINQMWFYFPCVQKRTNALNKNSKLTGKKQIPLSIAESTKAVWSVLYSVDSPTVSYTHLTLPTIYSV